MKIIFESEEEKEKMVTAIARCESCPSDVGLEDSCADTGNDCDACWKAALEAAEKKEA